MSALFDDAQGLNGAGGLRRAEAAQRLLKMRAARAGTPPMVDDAATVKLFGVWPSATSLYGRLCRGKALAGWRTRLHAHDADGIRLAR